jgi:hypothetical protein
MTSAHVNVFGSCLSKHSLRSSKPFEQMHDTAMQAGLLTHMALQFERPL